MARPVTALVLSVVLLSLLPAAIARAHPRIDAAREKFESADFQGALDELGRAVERQLTREDLVELLGLRALIHLGLGDQRAVRADLVELLSLEPDYRYDESAPPEVHEAVDRARRGIRAPIRVDATASPREGGVVLEASANADPGGLVDRVDVFARPAGAQWRRGPSPLEVDGDAIDWYAEAVGPGGAVLAGHGSRQEPIAWSSGRTVGIDPDGGDGGDGGDGEDGGDGGDGGDEEGGGRRAGLWIGVSAGTAVVVTVVVLAVVLSGGQSSASRPTFPMVAP